MVLYSNTSRPRDKPEAIQKKALLIYISEGYVTLHISESHFKINILSNQKCWKWSIGPCSPQGSRGYGSCGTSSRASVPAILGGCLLSCADNFSSQFHHTILKKCVVPKGFHKLFWSWWSPAFSRPTQLLL